MWVDCDGYEEQEEQTEVEKESGSHRTCGWHESCTEGVNNIRIYIAERMMI